MDYVTLECKTSGCENQYLPFDVEDNGTEIICSGSCGNILRANTPDHPNYPHISASEPSLEELVAIEVAKHLAAERK